MANEPIQCEEKLKDLSREDAACWNRAIQRHRDNKAEKKSSKKKFKLSEGDQSTIGSDDTPQFVKVDTVEDLIEAAQSSYRNSVKKRGKAKKAFYEIVSSLERQSKIISIFIQQEPKTTALIWGSIRFLLQAIVDCEQATEVAADCILLVVQHRERWSSIAQLFGCEKGIKEALIDLYVEVIDFLHSATKRFQKRAWARLAQSAFVGVREKFAKKLVKLRDAVDRLDKTANLEYIKRSIQKDDKILHIPQSPEASEETKRIMTDALSTFEANKGKWETDLQVAKIFDCLDLLANPITAQPNSAGVWARNALPKWLKANSKYRKWLEGKSSNLLWVIGKEGCGKSTLADQTRTDLVERQPIVISHAFQSNKSTTQRGRVSLAASILSKLLPSSYPVNQFQKSIFLQLLPLYNTYKSRFEDCPFEQLWPLCVSLLKEHRNFTLIIDGLDECTFEHPKQAKGLLEHISNLPHDAVSKVIIFSRPSRILKVGTSSQPQENEIRITRGDTISEINFFCDSVSGELSLPEELQLQVASRAKAGAHGSFLWATLFLEQFPEIRDMADFQKALEDFPSDCWDRYTEVWEKRVGNLDDDNNDKKKCRGLLLLLLGARRQFEIAELEDALGLIPESDMAQFIISTLCQPLVQVIDEKVQLSHASVRDFLLNDGDVGFSASDPDTALARTCLEFLLKDIYAREDRIGQLLRRNVGYSGSTHNQERSFYEYAARNWYIHLTALPSPDQSLLKLAGKFLHSLQFAHWAEYSITDMGDFQAIRSTEITLTVWMKKLSAHDRSLLHLDDYFELSYSNLNKAYEDSEDDKVLKWLALIHLGFYYFDKGKIAEMAQVRTEVAAGLSELLGKRHPLTLQASADAAYVFLFNKELKKAQKLYAEVAQNQRQVVDDDDPSPEFTLVYQAQTEYLMGDFLTAMGTLTDSMAGFIRKSGPQSNGYLTAQLWYAVANASAGHVKESIKILEFVRDKRKEQYGPEDSFGIATQIFAGDLYRKLGAQDKALEYIEPALAFRRGFWPIYHFLTLDTALVLAITYRDFRKDEEAVEIIDELEKDAKLDQEHNFVRYCQVRHLRALLLFEDGNVDQPIKMLEALLIDTDIENNNRALQWIRLDLAYMLRYRAKDGDTDLASSLFDGLVTNQLDDPGDEPDPPQWLVIAENALKLLRFDKVDAANDLLQGEELRWIREGDLWMWLGVPAADTGWIRLPQGLGDDGVADSSGWANTQSDGRG